MERAGLRQTIEALPQGLETILAEGGNLSMGQKQRIAIARAVAPRPRLLLLDEPTSALDVTIQAQILQQLNELRRQRGTAILLITHDFGVVAQMADEVAVMYAGRVVETGGVMEMLKAPLHPYTHGLLATLPRVDGANDLSDLVGLCHSIVFREVHQLRVTNPLVDVMASAFVTEAPTVACRQRAEVREPDTFWIRFRLGEQLLAWRHQRASMFDGTIYGTIFQY